MSIQRGSPGESRWIVAAPRAVFDQIGRVSLMESDIRASACLGKAGGLQAALGLTQVLRRFTSAAGRRTGSRSFGSRPPHLRSALWTDANFVYWRSVPLDPMSAGPTDGLPGASGPGVDRTSPTAVLPAKRHRPRTKVSVGLRSKRPTEIMGSDAPHTRPTDFSVSRMPCARARMDQRWNNFESTSRGAE